MKKIITIVIAGIAIIGVAVGVWYYMNFTTYAPKTYITETKTTDATGTTTVTTTTVNTETGTEVAGSPVFTLAEISTHNSATSCYTSISGTVYDLTMWVNMHPGGKGAILSICGIDGTDRFMNKHKGGEKYMNILERYKIGKLQA